MQFVDSDVPGVRFGTTRTASTTTGAARPANREHRPQGLVSVEHVHQRDLQGHDVQVTPQAETEREL